MVREAVPIDRLAFRLAILHYLKNLQNLKYKLGSNIFNYQGTYSIQSKPIKLF